VNLEANLAAGNPATILQVPKELIYRCVIKNLEKSLI
jgi:hypothetical protein